MARLSPGMMRHRVRILDPGATLDSYGQLTGTATARAEKWASVEPLSGRELESARAVSATVTHRVRMWYTDRINPKSQMLVLNTGKVLQVEAIIQPDMQREELELLCTEKVAGASPTT